MPACASLSPRPAMSPVDPNAQARFFYLALLGVVLAARLLQRYRAHPGTRLRRLSLWVPVILCLVLAYAFGERLAA